MGNFVASSHNLGYSTRNTAFSELTFKKSLIDDPFLKTCRAFHIKHEPNEVDAAISMVKSMRTSRNSKITKQLEANKVVYEVVNELQKKVLNKKSYKYKKHFEDYFKIIEKKANNVNLNNSNVYDDGLLDEEGKAVKYNSDSNHYPIYNIHGKIPKLVRFIRSRY